MMENWRDHGGRSELPRLDGQPVHRPAGDRDVQVPLDPVVYDYADRNFKFDDEFLQPALLPPGTPMFRDVNLLSFRQILRPNQ